MTEFSVKNLATGLIKLIAWEVYDHKTQQTIKTWLALQNIECMVPDWLNPDHSLTLAIKHEGMVHVLTIPNN